MKTRTLGEAFLEKIDDPRNPHSQTRTDAMLQIVVEVMESRKFFRPRRRREDRSVLYNIILKGVDD